MWASASFFGASAVVAVELNLLKIQVTTLKQLHNTFQFEYDFSKRHVCVERRWNSMIGHNSIACVHIFGYSNPNHAHRSYTQTPHAILSTRHSSTISCRLHPPSTSNSKQPWRTSSHLPSTPSKTSRRTLSRPLWWQLVAYFR